MKNTKWLIIDKNHTNNEIVLKLILFNFWRQKMIQVQYHDWTNTLRCRMLISYTVSKVILTFDDIEGHDIHIGFDIGYKYDIALSQYHSLRIRSSSGFLTCPYIGTYVQYILISYLIIGWYRDIFSWDPISGHTRYRVIPDIGYFQISGQYRVFPYIGYDFPDIGSSPISVHKMRPNIGSDIRIYGYGDMCILISGHTISG